MQQQQHDTVTHMDWHALSRAYCSTEAKSRFFAQRLERHDSDGTGLNFDLPAFDSADSVQALEAIANEFTGTCGTDSIADIQLTMFNNQVGGWPMKNIATLDDLLSAVRLVRSMNESVQRSCAGRLVARLELDPLLVDPTGADHREILNFLNFHNGLDFGDGCDEFAAGFLFTKKIYARGVLEGNISLRLPVSIWALAVARALLAIRTQPGA